MGWIREIFDNWQMNTADRQGRADNQSSNVASESTMTALDSRDPGELRIGMVLDSAAGSYYSIVDCQNGPDLPCVGIGSLHSNYLGVSECNLPVEGSRVVVYKPHATDNFGIIIGTLPAFDSNSPVVDGEPLWSYAGLGDLEPGASGSTESAYNTPLTNPDDTRNVHANATRPVDVFPGDWAQINDQDVGILVSRYKASLMASDRARIDVSLVDDLVRIVAGYLRIIDSQGETQVLNDGGYPSRWHSATSHQCEKSGFKDYGNPLTKNTGKHEQLPKSDEARYELIKEDVMSKRRLQLFTGWLGDMLDVFVAKPDPANNPELYSNEAKDQGLNHIHVDSCGRLVIRSAAGISLQRWDRIPIPKQMYELWDPEGDKIEEDYEPEEKKPVDWPDDHKYGRGLQVRDGYAWIHRMGYQRLHDQSIQGGGKDINLPEEKDLLTPDKKYDELGKAEEDYEKYDRRQAYMNVEDDGSIIIRDAWGSELLMRGGNIIFNCAGQLELRPGKSLVMLAGDDLIAKAKNSVDITATDKDVRVKAEGNLHMLAEGREGKGGILLESRADGEGVAFKGKKGEDVMSRGIILRAEKSSIFSQARTIHSSAERQHKIETFGEDEGNDGAIYLSARKLYSNMQRQHVFVTDKTAGLIIGRNSAILAGRQAALVGGRSIAIIKGQKAWIPFMEVPLEEDFYLELKPFFEQIHDWLQETPWLSPFLPDARDEIEFTYRTSQQYNTMKASEVHEASQFRVYQASWAYLKDVGFHTLTGVSKEEWIEYPIEETWPWPGEEHYDGGSAYVKLDDEINIEDKAYGIPKIRKVVTESVGPFSEHDFNKYEVVT